MTLIAAIKNENQGCIISDFRMTNEVTHVQQDVGLKYIGFDDRLMIYMAGKPSFLLPKLEEILPSIKDQLNFENVDQADSPLKFVLETIMADLESDCESSIIGVFLNKSTNEFKMFRMDLQFRGNGWEIGILPDQDFTWEVIGTGGILMDRDFFPSWRPFSLHEVFCKGIRPKVNANETYSISIETVADSIEQSIRMRLLSLGPSVFKKLGISPVMNISIIEGSHLRVRGAEYEVTTFSPDREVEITKYAIQKAPGDSAKLVDQNNKEIRAHQTNSDFPGTTTVPIIFDPLGVEGDDNTHPDYTLRQEINPLQGGAMEVVRYIRKKILREWSGESFEIRHDIKSQTELIDNMVNSIPEKFLFVNPFDFNEDEDLYWERVDLFDQQWIEQRYGKQSPFKLQTEEQDLVE
ncbi:hypothetical protein MHB77_31705 [Paenibacillus sp. FSL K6-3166]|uniref:hypothetical protein n=1 Tax=unclassified Paenibacillus TaxID=185978 RepID=UPI000BA14A64|nr:hypothetical protein [Paenibacillus sp. VTT E-133291]OZQ85776.1 hypothetical protein CA598_20140 [Paenibacillus sp. VTT E-133291]